MELYDSKFVYFDWNDNLKGKKGFFADNIYHLKQNVKDNRAFWYEDIYHSDNDNYPFKLIKGEGNSANFRFCYYDPYYEFRRAYLEGKTIQFKDYKSDWVDVDGEPLFNSGRDVYRIKPETKWHVAISEHSLFRTRNPSEDETVVFSGTEDECIEWFKEHKQFEDIMLAWKQGKTIQYLYHDDWIDVANNIPVWGLNNTYRVKPSETFYAEYFDNHIVKSHHPVPENVLFKSEREKEVDLFIDDSEYLEEIIKAAREGKIIQFKEFGVHNDPWKRCVGWDDLSQHDFVHYEYRIDECTKCLKYNTCCTPGKRCKNYCTKVDYVPFDSVQELIDAWEKKSGVKFNHELAMPFIWIKNKQKNRVYLITDFLFDKYFNDDIGTEDSNLQLKGLFEDYTFLDNSIIGKVKE